jgi:hypothetical protein
MRRAALVLLLFVVGCATARRATKDELRAQCEADVGSDPRCIGVLTQAEGGLEAHDQLVQAEEDREDDAFSARLKRLRDAQDEKARFAAAKTSTAADQPADEESFDSDEEDSGSSVRALTGEAPPTKIAPEPRPPLKIVVPKVEPPARSPDPPTPESYLRASACLLRADTALMRALLTSEKAKKSRGAKADPGAFAMVIVEADALESAVRAEMDHRGLPADRAKCSTQGVEEVVEVLRRVTGKAAGESSDIEAYAAGLGRLRKELEVRAGLPRQKSVDQATE